MKKKKNIRTLDVVLVVIAVFLLLFIGIMLWMYYRTGGIPDTLCTCVFAISGGECGVMGPQRSDTGTGNMSWRIASMKKKGRIPKRIRNRRKS